MSSVSFHETKALNEGQYNSLLRRSETDLSFFLERVKPIIEAVRKEGDAALVRFGQEFDGAKPLTLKTLKASEAEFDAAFDEVDDEVIAAADEHGIAMVFTGIRHFLH